MFVSLITSLESTFSGFAELHSHKPWPCLLLLFCLPFSIWNFFGALGFVSLKTPVDLQKGMLGFIICLLLPVFTCCQNQWYFVLVMLTLSSEELITSSLTYCFFLGFHDSTFYRFSLCLSGSFFSESFVASSFAQLVNVGTVLDVGRAQECLPHPASSP